jgi:hypothetical protein
MSYNEISLIQKIKELRDLMFSNYYALVIASHTTDAHAHPFQSPFNRNSLLRLNIKEYGLVHVAQCHNNAALTDG